MKDKFDQGRMTASRIYADGPRVGINSVRNPEEVLYKDIARNPRNFDSLPTEKKVEYLTFVAMPMLFASMAGELDSLDNGHVGHSSMGMDRDDANNSVHPDVSIDSNPSGITAIAVNWYEQFVDKNPVTGESFYPDTPTSQINMAKELMGIDKSVRITGGMSELWKIAAKRAEEQGATEAQKFLLAALFVRNIIPNEDGLYHIKVDSKNRASSEKVTTEEALKEIAPLVILRNIHEDFSNNSNSDPTPDSPSGDETHPAVETKVVEVEATEQVINTQVNGLFSTAEQSVEDNFLSQHTDRLPEFTTPWDIEVNLGEETTTFNLVKSSNEFFFLVNSDWEKLNVMETTFTNPENNSQVPFTVLVDSTGSPIIWYPQQMSSDTSNVNIYFAPPIELESSIPGFSRADNEGIPIQVPITLLPEVFEGEGVEVGIDNVSGTEIPPLSSLVETLTPEANVDGNMTLEDWKKVFSGPYTADNNQQYDLSITLESDFASTLTDPELVANLPVGTSMMILNPSGEITIFADPSEAAEKVRNGAIVIVSDSTLPDSIAKNAIRAANQAYLNGNHNISVVFDEMTRDGLAVGIQLDIDKYFLLEKDGDGRFVSPVVKMPKHFFAYDEETNKHYPVPENFKDPILWIDYIINAGYEGISAETSSSTIK